MNSVDWRKIPTEVGVKRAIMLCLILGVATGLSACDGGTEETQGSSQTEQGQSLQLPDVAEFAADKSDQVPIDLSSVSAVAPYLGKSSSMPHQGMHFNFRGDGVFAQQLEPSKYPAVYAVEDGVMTMVESLHHNGQNDRYGFSIQFANAGGDPVTLNYSLEPFIPEPSPGLYAQFILVKNGQSVKKGDQLGYLYVPPGLLQGPHLHLDVNIGQSKYPPALFSASAVSQMQAKFGDPGGTENGTPLPACIGYKIAASENPFASAASECLN